MFLDIYLHPFLKTNSFTSDNNITRFHRHPISRSPTPIFLSYISYIFFIAFFFSIFVTLLTLIYGHLSFIYFPPKHITYKTTKISLFLSYTV